MTEFKIYDFRGNEKVVKLDLTKISVVMKYVISGDEILEVFYKDGDRQWIDSMNPDLGFRITHYFDGSELIYLSDMEEWKLWQEQM